MGRIYTRQEKLMRIIAGFGFFFGILALINNYVSGLDDFPLTQSPVFPDAVFIVPATHAFSMLLALIVFIFPSKIKLLLSGFVIESVHQVITGFQHTGIFFYASFIVLAFVLGYLKTYFWTKLIGIIVFWMMLLSTLIFFYGFTEFLFMFGLSAFLGAVYYVFYQIVKNQVSFLVCDINPVEISGEFTLPEKGGVLKLENFPLTERQIACIKYTMESDYGYRQIASELITSESTIKKEMQELYRLFGVKNREMLRLLLIQYKIAY